MKSNNQYKRRRMYNKSFLSILVLFLIAFSFNCVWADSGNSISTYIDTVQKVYIGYYQRPADPEGLLYWAAKLDARAGNLNEIIEAFANSAESQALYGTINSSNISTVVNSIYNALFGRSAEAAGLSYYVNGFNSGQFTAATIMLNILNGAQNEDLLSVTNKVTTSNLFTRTIDPELDGRDYQATYSGNADAQKGRDFLSTVGWNPVTIPTQAETTAYIQDNIADSGDPILMATATLEFPFSNPENVVRMAAWGIPNWSGTEPHNGIDLEVSESLPSAKIISPTAGVVTSVTTSENPFSNPPGQLSLEIAIRVNDEWNVNLCLEPGTTDPALKSAQLAAVRVSPGQDVSVGTHVVDLLVGSLGYPHLHYMVSRGDQNVCAYKYSSGVAKSIFDEIAATRPNNYLPDGNICYGQGNSGDISMTTPYVRSSDIASINEAFSSSASAPWGFAHNGIDFMPNGNFKPFQAVSSGLVDYLNLWQNDMTSNWQVGVRLKYNDTYLVWYVFEPMSAVKSDGDTQLANILVSAGQNVSQGDIIGNLYTLGNGAHVHWGLVKDGVWICPEPYFTSEARDSILNLLHVVWPGASMCY